MYYSKAQAKDSQYQLIDQYAPLVKRIAYHLLARLPASVQVDDLMQAGMIGLLEASGATDGGARGGGWSAVAARVGTYLDLTACFIPQTPSKRSPHAIRPRL